ncbi:Protein BFR2 [Candida tropicalis]
MAKKSLADQISSLYTPKTDYDIEDHDLGQANGDHIFDHNDGSDIGSEDEDDDEELRKEHYVETSKSKLRQNNTRVNLGEKYVGDVVSRNDLYNNDDDASEQEGEEESEEEVEVEEAINSNEEEEEISDVSESEEEGNQSDSDEEDEEEDEESESEEEESSSSHKRQLLKQLMSKERSHIVNRLSQSATNDALKGYAIQLQNKTFEKIIDVRLKFQKSVTSSNLLPINSITYEEVKSEDSDKLLKQAKSELFELLDGLFSLRNELEDNEENKITSPKKRSFSKYSEVTTKADSELNSKRNVVLTKWSAKVSNSSGSNAMNANKFRTINQSFEQQVNNNLSDMDRLIKRTKLNRRNITPIGYNPEDHQNQQEEKDGDGHDDDEDIPEETMIRKKAQGSENPFIFDDEDFYRVLLNDLVDKKVQSSDPTTGITINLRSAQKVNKLKNNVDTKASKGRKLRYHIQEPIANFESSIGSWKWNDDQIDEFFASLLGQKVNMNEIDEDDNNNDEENDDDIIPEDNGIQLFG